jgi:predicted nucleotidyltransferase
MRGQTAMSTCWSNSRAKRDRVFLDLAEIDQELAGLLSGRRVDLRTADDLSRYFREEVLSEAKVQYESA